MIWLVLMMVYKISWDTCRIQSSKEVKSMWSFSMISYHNDSYLMVDIISWISVVINVNFIVNLKSFMQDEI